MNFQDHLTDSYIRLSSKEHRKRFAQFFTPESIASLMASYILENDRCSRVLDPANGLSVFARAIDEQLCIKNLTSVGNTYAFFADDMYRNNTSYVSHFRSLCRNKYICSRCSGIFFCSADELTCSLLRAYILHNTPIEALTLQSCTANSRMYSVDGKHGDNNFLSDLDMRSEDFDMYGGGISLQIKHVYGSEVSIIRAERESKGNKGTEGTHSDSFMTLLEETDKANARRISITSYEIDPVICGFATVSAAHNPFHYVSLEIKNKDYLKSSFKERYDGVICNPPYKAMKEYFGTAENIEILEKRLNINLSRRTNLYALFLLKSLEQLKSDGRCAYLIPYEFLNSGFGIRIKEQILKSGSLDCVITFASHEQVFDDATTTCGIFLFDKAVRHDSVRFITVSSQSDLDEVRRILCPKAAAAENNSFFCKSRFSVSDRTKDYEMLNKTCCPALLSALPQQNLTQLAGKGGVIPDDLFLKVTAERSSDRKTISIRSVPYSWLKANQKWHIHYSESGGEKSGSDSLLLSSFDRYIRVKRGLATGANEFFLFNRSKIEKTKIPEKYFVRVVPRSSIIENPVFTDKDFEQLANADAFVFLLNAPTTVTDPDLKAYLAQGEKEGIHKRYLTAHRCPWYVPEKRRVAPILISVFNRQTIRVVRNEAGICNLTTFHSVFTEDERQTDLIFAYLLTPLAKEIILQNRREYGGGLKKLEPLDINHAQCVNFDALGDTLTEKILSLYREYRESLLRGEDPAHTQEILNAVTKCFRNFLKGRE